MWEIVRGLMTSLLVDQWPLVAGAILCVAAGWLLRDRVEKIINTRRKGKKNNDTGTQMEGYRTENEDSENKTVSEPNKEIEISEILDWAARNTTRNKGNVFELKEIWVDAIEPNPA